MFINNVTGKPIKDITFEGYLFSIPAGVSLVWDKFGAFVLDLYKPAGEGVGIPPVLAATAKQWKGVLFADVRRYEINPELIRNRKDLLKIAKQRGVDAETLEQWNEDETIDNAEIAKTINALDVPEQVKYPTIPEDGAVETDTVVEDAAEAALNAPETPVVDSTTTQEAPGAAKVVTPTPGTNKGKTNAPKGKTGAKAAAKTPKTPAKRK